MLDTLNTWAQRMNSSAGMNAINGFVDSKAGSVLKNVGDLISNLPQPSGMQQPTPKQQAGLAAMETGMNALEQVPVVGKFAQVGNLANKLMPDFLAGGTTQDQFINKIPGMKMLNFKVGKTNSFTADPAVTASGAFGGVKKAQNAATDLAGKNVGLFSIGKKGKMNKKIQDTKNLQNQTGDLLEEGNLATDNQFNLSQDLAAESQLKRLGGFNSIAVGKNGMKFDSQAKRVANKRRKIGFVKDQDNNSHITQIGIFKEGGKVEDMSIIPGGALHAHKHNLKNIDKQLAKQITHKGVPVITFQDGGEVTQQAEIEVGEIIFRKEITEELEELWEDGSEEAMIEAGKLIAEEIKNNTIDKSGEYEIED